MATLTAAADGSHLSGAMIALMPTPEDAERLAIEGGEDAEQLHVTLYFLGDDGSTFGETERAGLIDALTMAAQDYVRGPIAGRVFGANHWNAGSDSPSWVWAVGDDRGDDRKAGAPCLSDAYEAAGIAVRTALDFELLPEQYTPWVPHVCAQYSEDLALAAELESRLGPVTFDRIRVAFGGDNTDIPLGDGTLTAAADGPLRRQPTDLEVASHVDFADMNDAWHKVVDDTVAQWAAVQDAQRAQIVAQVKTAVDAGKLDQLDTATVDTGDAEALLYKQMRAMAQRAGEAQQREAEAQGVTVPDWSLDDEAVTAAGSVRDRLLQVARATARGLGVGLVQSAVRRAVQLFGSGTGAQVAAQVDEHLAGLSDASVRDAVGGAMSAAQNEGRMAVLAVTPPAEYVATEILDSKRTCKPCRQIDGTRYTTLPDARRAYPNGGYTGCLGGTRCRGTLVTVWPQPNTAATAGTITLAAGATLPSDMNGGGNVPYSIVQDHPDCAADMPWAVVQTDSEELMGCHPDQPAAQAQMDKLMAAEGDMPKDMPDKPMGMPRQDGYLTEMGGQTAPWEGVLIVEGQVTGDAREFMPDALSWQEPPIPLRWNKEDSHGGEPHTVAVNVGRIDEIWRDGNKIMGRGALNLGEEDGRRVHDMIKGKFIRGVSIDADSIANPDVEFVWPDDANEGMDDDGDLMEILFSQPEKVVYHGGRIRAATLCDIPAFVEAWVALLDDMGTIIAGGTPVTADEVRSAYSVHQFGAVGTHKTATSDASWDAGVNEKRLPSPLTVAQARAAYAWYDSAAVQDGKIVKTACKFLHHEINADGSAGPANLAACSATIGALHGGRGGTTIPAADRRGVYDHVAGHLRDAGQEPMPFQSLPALTAGALELWQPPVAWFSDPRLSLPTGITITDEGRIYGHAAQWGSCHIGNDGACIQPPREAEHPYYQTGEVKCDDGTRVAVGQITVGTGHAPLHLGAGPAAEHYDNTGSAVADVAVGNDAHGIWVAGAVRPGVDPLKVYELQAAGQVSGDWRRIGGQLRLVGLLAVNVPGFPVPRMRARVASGQPQALVAAGRPQVAFGLSEREVQRQALRIVMGMLKDRVHGGR